MFAAKTKRQAEKAEPQTRPRRKLTRAERKQIEAAIARANRTGKKERSAQDSIPYERMWPDGICKVADGRYTKTIQFQDINYQLSQNEDKAAIFEGWCDFLNYFDSSIRFQLSFLNLAASQETFVSSITIPPQGDDFDPIRVEYTQMLQNQLARGNNGLIKTKYLTFSIEADSIRTAKPRLERIETDVLNNFKRLGVAAEALDGKARLAQLHAIFHMDEQVPFQFEWDWLAPSGLSTKDFIAPSGFEFRTGKQFRMGRKYGAVSFVQILAPELNDRMLVDFLDMESSLIVNLHIQSVDQVDSITGRIARQLYPNARIEVNGFEKTQYPDGVFDLAIGNVPFGNYRVSDRPYDRHNLLIHDYFFAKTIDKVRAGGIIAFITSNGISGGTMDKKDAHAREYMARRCDLLGAVRLPNTTFRANAGTDIAMDIVFLQKREVPRMQGEPLPEWVETDLLRTNTYMDKDGRERHDHVTMNRYFRTHPEMVLGDLDIVTGPFGPQLVCNPKEGADLEQQLREAMQHIQGRYTEAELPELGEGEDIDTSLPADPDVKNYSYTVVDGAVYFRENSRMVRPDLNATAEARVKGLLGLRDCVQRLIDLEMDAAAPEAAIQGQMAELNRLYDDFSAKYGLINDRANRLAFADDSSYYLLCALEVLDEDGKLERKADMFSKRTIKPHEAVTTVDTASEALAVSISEKACVDMGHSQFEKIPISKERQERLLSEQIDEITAGIDEVERSNGERFTVKQLERTRKSLEARLEKLQAEGRKDDVVTFEQLGVDRMFVDEAHNYKNLFLYTKMRNVAGLSTTDAQKSSDMFAKCRYMDEITGNRGVIFATGTPVSNSMTELYTMQRYLQYDRLQELGMTHFDCWASRFGETVTALELAPEGTGYRARTRFSKFFNLPELMNLFKEVADIKTADQLHLPTPQVEYHNVVAHPTEIQKEMVQALSERASQVHSGSVDPKVDNMLKITSDGRKLGLDQRLINQMLPDEPGTKVNQCVDNILRIWRDGEADKLTQLVFCDISTPQAKPAKKVAKALDNPTLHALEDAVPLPEPEPAFTVYEDIRQKLIAQGMPAEQIAFIHEANTEVRKKELFSKVRTGQVRVLLGSTAKMGAGTNVQDRLIALHDLDCPWRPGDLAQRKGRIERQGNQNETVHVFRYVTEGTFDAYLWQTVENKQKFISQIMTSKSPVRSCDDVDETALSFAEIKALCAGDPRIKERMDLDVDVSRLKLLKADHQSKQYHLEDQLLQYFPREIEANKGFIQGFEADMETLAAHPHPEDGFAGMEVRGDTLTDKENAGAALLDACKEVINSEPVAIGSYRGFAMSVEFNAFSKEYTLLLKGQMTHRATLGTDPRGNLTRIDNALAQMPQRLQSVQNQLDNLYQQQAAAKAEVGKPFPQEQELRDKSARLAELDVLLNIDGNKHPAQETVLAKSTRPSVLEGLRRPVPPRAPEKKPKHHEQEVR